MNNQMSQHRKKFSPVDFTSFFLLINNW